MEGILRNIGLSNKDFEMADEKYGTLPITLCIKSGCIDVNCDFKNHPLYEHSKPQTCSKQYLEFIKDVNLSQNIPDLYTFLYFFDKMMMEG